MATVLLSFGTRPEAIKLAPLYKELIRRSDRIRLRCCVTGQHRDLLDPILEAFDIHADHDLNIIAKDQSLFHITTSVLEGMKGVLASDAPDLLLVQGDTSSAFVSALAAFYARIPIGHVEAGLRSYDRSQPFPEETNRTLISHIADLHFCPTPRAADNLLREQIEPSSVHVTGNTVIDALLAAVKILEDGHEADEYLSELGLPPGRMILVTGHRRENFSGGLAALSRALVDIANTFPDVTVVYSVHPNPNVRKQVGEILSGHERIRMIKPPDYFKFVSLMNRAHCIITDSGGIQEEAPSLKKPVLVARNLTERPEAVEAGLAIIVGTNRDKIVTEASRLLAEPDHFASMITNDNPFGDGHASERIADIIETFLSPR